MKNNQIKVTVKCSEVAKTENGFVTRFINDDKSSSKIASEYSSRFELQTPELPSEITPGNHYQFTLKEFTLPKDEDNA
jgi:hypothetical protein